MNPEKLSKSKPLLEMKYLIITGLVFLFFLPALLTQTSWYLWDFSNVGQVGDTIGGITAPFVGLLGAYLVYKAFEAQVKANQIQSEANEVQRKTAEFEVALKLIDDLGNKLNANTYRHEDLVDPKIKEISNANFYEIIRFWPIMKSYRRDYLGKIVLVIRQVKYLIRYIEASKSLTVQDKNRLLERTVLTIGSDLSAAFKTFLMTSTERNSWPKDEQHFFLFCEKFYDKTLDSLLFFLIDLEEFNEQYQRNDSQ